jgi:hypothetical protein
MFRKQSFLALLMLLLSACANPSRTPLPTFTPSYLTTTPGPTEDWSKFELTATAYPLSVDLIVDPVEPKLGDLVSVSWVTHGAEGDGWHMRLVLIGDLPVAPGHRAWPDLPLNGHLNVMINSEERHSYRFILLLSNTDVNVMGATDTEFVFFPCPDVFFFGEWQYNICPTAPAEHPQAVQQDFQGGRMIWIDSKNEVYVMYPDGLLEVYPTTWVASEPEIVPSMTPPANGFPPASQFDRVWRRDHSLREALGWALAPAQEFTSTVQSEYPRGGIADGVPIDFIQLADGSAIGFLISYGHGGHPYWFYVNP